jgi:hypothetical protein
MAGLVTATSPSLAQRSTIEVARTGSPAAALLVMPLEERINTLHQRVQRSTERGPDEPGSAGSPAS